jgi:hypothetical protein
MLPSVRALLTGIIDYAGLFPPARLELSAAIHRFRRHSAGPDGWMLARFVVPAPLLQELPPLLDTSSEPQPAMRLATLVRAGELSGDLADLRAFAGRCPGQATVDQLEVRLPDEPDQIAGVVERCLEAIRAGAVEAVPFFEPSLLDGWQERLSRTVTAIAAAGTAGLKIRCGGLNASDVPSPSAVAAALATCLGSGVPLKATQGLHQPLRHWNAGLATTAHGFLNLFAAGVLGQVHRLAEPELLAIVEEREPGAFRFDREHLVWRERAAGVDAITAARRAAVSSFGSCSFAEPRDALRELGLLPAGGPARS